RARPRRLPPRRARPRRLTPRRARPRRLLPRRRRPRRAPPRSRPDALARRRLDAELVRRGLVGSPQQAQAEIAAGRVTVGGAPADRSARLVAPGEPIAVLGPPARFVGRGGEKLEGALARFAVDVEGRRALDAG